MKISQTTTALTILYEVLYARKYKTWSLTYESVCIYYIDLCCKVRMR